MIPDNSGLGCKFQGRSQNSISAKIFQKMSNKWLELFYELPYVAALSNEFLKNRCSNCFASTTSLCSKCGRRHLLRRTMSRQRSTVASNRMRGNARSVFDRRSNDRSIRYAPTFGRRSGFVEYWISQNRQSTILSIKPLGLFFRFFFSSVSFFFL